MIRRLYVEKKKEFGTEEKALCRELADNLDIKGLREVRILNRYDVENISDAEYEKAKNTIFSEPATDIIFEEDFPVEEQSLCYAVEYLPGQYDQRADSAEQCIRMISPQAKPIVRCAKVYVISGTVSEEERDKIIKFCVNPVDSRFADMSKPENLNMDIKQVEVEKRIVGFCNMTEEELQKYIRTEGLAMSIDDIKMVRDYFNKEERNPTLTEIKVIDTYWSDHCRHTTFNTILEQIEFEDGEYSNVVKAAFERYLEIRVNKEKPVSLMDMGTVATKYLKKYGKITGLDESEEINACSIKVKAKNEKDHTEEDWLVMFKNETHNHPTEIEPFGGAATCLGGAIRDPLSGRSYVYQAMRVTGAGDPTVPVENTLEGKLPQRKITTEAARGYSSYGNQIGVATGQVYEIYDPGYVSKRMEIGAVVGAAPAKNVIRKRPEKDDLIILVGGRTGRDGCGGATGSSKKHDKDSVETAGAEVQKGNPIIERNLQRLFRRAEASTLIKRCNDFGAGGVSVAVGELADSIDVDLDSVPKKYEGLSGTELAISESQERMAVVVASSDKDNFIKFAREENLEAAVIAKVTDTGRFRMFFKDSAIFDISREFLNTNGAAASAKVFIKNRDLRNYEERSIGEHGKFGQLNCCSQKGLVSNFDSTIGQGSVLMPLGGKYQRTPAMGMCAKLPTGIKDTSTATIMTWGYDCDIAKTAPYYGGMYAVIDAVAKAAAMGADYRDIKLSLQEYFPSPGENAEKWALPVEALLGALTSELELEIGAIGGKDSMSGTFQDMEVPPTIVAFACNVMDANHVVSSEFKKENSRIYMLHSGIGKPETFDFKSFKKNLEWINKNIKYNKISACGTVGKGGIFGSIAKMAMGNEIGFNGDLQKVLNIYGENILNIPIPGAMIFEVSEGFPEKDLAGANGIIYLGNTNSEKTIDFGSMKINMDKLVSMWDEPLEKVFATKLTNENTSVAMQPGYYKRNSFNPVKCEPQIVIPVFPGTNCEEDSRIAFEREGGKVKIVLIKNRDAEDLEDSIKVLAESIKESQIVFIPGGFSGGDEPDGSAKFITSVFRNPSVRKQIEDLMDKRDGLMLGICNGFQALVKLGLLPFGEIRDMDDESPTLTHNLIGRHVSAMVQTRVASVKSPWFKNVSVGDIHTIPVSHGEGRFAASKRILEDLINNGQIATQYVDFSGTATMKTEFNPNGSVMAIEGITSRDGRILGKMGHSERTGTNLYKNIPGNREQHIFRSAIEFFK